MCGISAYKGKRQAGPLLVNALKTLEYRGYDSAGLAVFGKEVVIKKGVGKVAEVDRKVHFEQLKGTTGIAHTRWATTGAVTGENSHPHKSNDGRFVLVQNGIVENYLDLKNTLIREGFTFTTQTDTEVIANLIEKESKSNGFLEAIHKAFIQLHGRNSIVVLDTTTGDLIAAKNGSPLILGMGDDEWFLASDVTPLLEHTKEVIFIEDNQYVHLNSTYKFYDSQLLPIEPGMTTIDWSVEQARKGNYPHYMIKEIMEQRDSIAHAIAQPKEDISRVAGMINDAFGTYAVGCGTTGSVGFVATYIFSQVARKHINFAIGSEFPEFRPFLTEDSLLLAISQSGETADTLEAIESIQDKGGKVVSIVNVMGSTVMRKADASLMVQVGPETSVCSTKATTGQIAILYLLAYACVGKYEEGLRELQKTVDAVQGFLTEEYCASVKAVADRLLNVEHIYIIGRGANYPIAKEAAIKLQEVSYIHAEGFAGGELKHGPIALIDEGTPCIAFVPNDKTKEDILANATEVKTRGGLIIGIAPENNEAFDIWIEVPDVLTSPIVNIIPIQLLAYYLAVGRENDVDQPRNLAKSVTVK